MADYNPYETPKATVGPSTRGPLFYVVLAASGIAALIAIVPLPMMYELTSTGAIHPVPFLCFLAATVLELIGAVLIVFRKRAAAYVLGSALIFAIGGAATFRSGGMILFTVFVAIAFGASLRR